ncbi:MAG TPA: c-type cytochrome [Saprospiraceae bacterium]|nr:c-type cytochrome [Saprospiraceae bacterium]
MKKVLKWTGIVLLTLVLIVLIGSWLLARKFNMEFVKKYELTPAPVAIPTDSASIERGRTLTVGCRNCHDVDLAGKVFFDDPKIGSLASSNLTRAKDSDTEGYKDEDFVRAIRHGLNKRGNPLMVMPSEAYTHYSDQDLGCIIAYLKSLPPIERRFAKRHFTYMSQVMAGAGMFGNLFPYKVIDHEKAKNITAPPIGNSIEYGKYVVDFDGCKNCHGADFGGGKSPDPVSPPVPDISTGSNSGKWTLEQFINTFRTGKTPEGKALQGQFMPFAGIGALSDVEIEAVYKYIHSLPAAEKKGE